MYKDFRFIQIKNGRAYPLGTFKEGIGINFAIFSRHASRVFLCLFFPHSAQPSLEIALDHKKNRTGYIWHIFLENLPESFGYGYRLEGPFEATIGHLFNPSAIISDPYSKEISFPKEELLKEKRAFSYLSKITPETPFDWEEDLHPEIPLQELILYEAHVRGFTQDPSSKVSHPGTFRGLIEKIPYLQELGINAIELMPIFAFPKNSNTHIHPKTHAYLPDYWGYSPINFFALMEEYASSASAIHEFKEMVKELHKKGIEVILDVVFNHTAEGSDRKYYINFRGIDNAIYYLHDKKGDYINFSGCGNTLNCNGSPALHVILDSLRYWVAEMHVDGFRFDLATILTRRKDGDPLAHPPLILAICQDPILSHTKLIAEPWDAGGLYLLGHFPTWGRWSEWNGSYRDLVRKFIKGTPGTIGGFAESICGSQNIYGKVQHPFYSINYITSHDGFTLKDLVSYQEKHNWNNGEYNRDGSNHNDSWNCGVEGDTDKQEILALRKKQMKNFFLALMISQGIPMILMGDEYGHTRQGNNNPWNQDNATNWFLWDKLDKEKDFFRFVRLLISFRKSHPMLQRIQFLKESDIDWHGKEPSKPHWGYEEKFIAFTLKGKESFLYIAFNASSKDVEATLPSPPTGKDWKRVVDTALPSPEDFSEKTSLQKITYTVKAHSSILFESF